jgi:hypothetical protein
MKSQTRREVARLCAENPGRLCSLMEQHGLLCGLVVCDESCLGPKRSNVAAKYSPILQDEVPTALALTHQTACRHSSGDNVALKYCIIVCCYICFSTWYVCVCMCVCMYLCIFLIPCLFAICNDAMLGRYSSFADSDHGVFLMIQWSNRSRKETKKQNNGLLRSAHQHPSVCKKTSKALWVWREGVV